MGSELETAITEAVKKEDDKTKESSEETKTETKVEEKTEEKTTEEKSTPDEDTVKAVEFYKMMQDPEKSRAYIEELAIKAGFKKAETKTEVKEAEKNFKELLLEGIPEEYQFMAEGMAVGMEKAMQKMIADAVVELRKDVDTQKATDAGRTIEQVYTKLSGEFEDFDKYDDDMAKLAEEMPMGKGVSLEKYLRRLYTLASGNKKVDTKKVETIDKIKKNREDADSASDKANSDTVKKGSGKPSLDESIREAMKQHSVD